MRLSKDECQANDAHGSYDRGWLSVDSEGYATRIDPKAVIIALAGVEWKNTISVRGVVTSPSGRIDNLPRDEEHRNATS